MTTKQERTPGLWHFKKNPMGIGIWPHDEEDIIAEVERLEDASHIVHCVNTYDEVVGAFEDLVMAVELPGDHGHIDPALDRARAALKLANSKGNGE